MRSLNYKETYQKLLTPEIVSYLAQIHEQKGQQNLFIEAHKDALSELLEIAKIQSTEASNRIEGIITTDDRLKKIVRNKTAPRNRNEREIAGYRDVLTTIHENYDFIPVRPGMLLQLHRDLYKFNNPGFGGNYKNSDNIISEETKITNYMIYIKTKLKKKFIHSKDKFNIQQQNNLMNRFIFKCTDTNFELYNDGFLYKFDDFNKIDNVLDVLFRLINSNAPLDYVICIQADDNIKQLEKLAALEYFGKIVFCADTLLRYKCNKSHRYGTQCAGIVQISEDKTLEIHEFQKIL